MGLMVLASSSPFTDLTALEARQRSATPLAITVTAHLRKPYGLAFVLTHESGPPVEVSESSLPWGIRSNRLVIAVTSGRTILPENLYIDDPGPGTQRMSKGMTLRGTVDLARDFQLLADIAKRQDVIVFWSYVLKTVDGQTLPRTGGFVLIPKGTS